MKLLSPWYVNLMELFDMILHKSHYANVNTIKFWVSNICGALGPLKVAQALAQGILNSSGEPFMLLHTARCICRVERFGCRHPTYILKSLEHDKILCETSSTAH